MAETLADTWAYVGHDECLKFFGTALRETRPPIAPVGAVLEIGCAEGDWITPAMQAWPGMTFTGIDWRGASRKCHVIKGDVLTHPFPNASFDLIVSVSAIEHVGLGHYKQDPKDRDGDSKAIQRAYAWLKPGGWLYVDVPYNSGKDAYMVHGTSHRIYDDATIASRLLQGLPWHEHARVYARPKDTNVLTTDLPRLAGGDRFYYVGLWLQKGDA